MVLLSVIITVFYLFLIGGFIVGFNKIPVFKLKRNEPKTEFSILIPFRNEAENLDDLLKSIEKLNYPKNYFEIIFIDDDSEDHSVSIIQEYRNLTNIKIVSNNRKTLSPKKDAITTAIEIAKYDWIITTDADCILPIYWLDCFNEFIQKTDAVCVAAPVTYQEKNTFLNHFQLLDFLSLQGISIGGFGINRPFLCNGANFGYKKSVFLELNGFHGNSNIASGDDVFLLEKIAKKHKKNVFYLKSPLAIITTKSQATWQKLLSQRSRWAAKTPAYKNWFGKTAGTLALSTNALVLVLPIFTSIKLFPTSPLVYIIAFKFCADLYLIYKTAAFYNQKKVLKSFPMAFIAYPVFVVLVAFTSLFKGYKWKGREFKK